MNRERRGAVRTPRVSNERAAQGKFRRWAVWLIPALFPLLCLGLGWRVVEPELRHHLFGPTNPPGLPGAAAAACFSPLLFCLAQWEADPARGALLTLMEVIAILLPAALLARVLAPRHAAWISLAPAAAWMLLQPGRSAPLHATALALSAALWGGYLLACVCRPKLKGASKRELSFKWSIAAQTGLIGVMGAGLWVNLDFREKALARVDLCARKGDWSGVLAHARGIPNPPAATRVDTHRALYHLGGLGERLFTIPQSKEVGLIPDLTAEPGAYLPLSELWYDLGMINAAQHYVCEAMEMRGPRPWILRQQARICLAKNQPVAARIFLNRLRAFPFQREWAENRLKEVESGGLVPELERAQRLTPSSDLVITRWDPVTTLAHLCEGCPTNRMAFEFLMAHHLLAFDLEGFAGELSRWPATAGEPLPVLFEEAYLLYQEAPRGPLPDLQGRAIRAETARRFADFKALIRQHGMKSKELELALAPAYGQTVWFYFLFGHTPRPRAS